MNRVLRVVVQVFALALLCDSLSGREGDECTSGFMSLDRMDDLLDNDGRVVTADNYQGIFPEVGFTCSGSVLGWVFGAFWVGQSLLPELQIWRPVGDGAYTKVGNTTIMTGEGSTQFKEYISSSPLAFQAGDVLGYYQPNPFQSQSRLMFEPNGRGQQIGYFYSGLSPASDLYLPWGVRSNTFQILVNVVTDSPGCVSGFMSEERMIVLLNLDSPSSLINTERRQQISPEMRFTCDGMITKWIIGAEWSSQFGDSLYPELQVWRNIENDTYQKISGTHVFFAFNSNMQPNRIYEYSSFSPIPVLSGDILGIFLPQDSVSKLRLRSESTSSPTQYYVFTGDSVTSPYDVINIGGINDTTYHPLVTAEIMRYSTPTIEAPTTAVEGDKATSLLLDVKSSPTVSPEEGLRGCEVSIIVGVVVGVVVLIAAALVFISLTVCLRRRTRKKLAITAENTANGVSGEEIELSGNTAYSTTAAGDRARDDEDKYEYITESDVTAHPSSSTVAVSDNQAYGLVQS